MTHYPSEREGRSVCGVRARRWSQAPTCRECRMAAWEAWKEEHPLPPDTMPMKKRAEAIRARDAAERAWRGEAYGLT